MKDLDLASQRVLLREDLNVPLRDGEVANDARIRAALPTIRLAADSGAKVAVVSHLGRPVEGRFDPALSLAPVARRLAALLQREVPLVADWLDGVAVRAGEMVLCENVRFNVGEKSDDASRARRMASTCDVFVMDAFGTAHRAQASTHGVARFAPIACAGPLLAAELDALSRALREPARPLVAIVGGAKVSTKLGVLESLVEAVDQLIVGGGIANTFIAAAGHEIGRSLSEPGLVATAERLRRVANERGSMIPIPSDVVVGPELSDDARAEIKPVHAVRAVDRILDIGPETRSRYAKLLQSAGTIVWNGPLGAFEYPPFAAGTRAIADAVAASAAFSIAGGGDTLAAIEQFEVAERISYLSTGGGAFLEFLEGKKLPALAALESRAST